MVDDRAIERFGGTGESGRRSLVGAAWPAIPARVSVSEDDPGAPVDRRICDDRPEREVGAGLVSVMVRQAKAIRMAVDMGHPEPFPAGVAFGKATGKECARGGDAVEFQREFGTLMSHPGLEYRRQPKRTTTS